MRTYILHAARHIEHATLKSRLLAVSGMHESYMLNFGFWAVP